MLGLHADFSHVWGRRTERLHFGLGGLKEPAESLIHFVLQVLEEFISFRFALGLENSFLRILACLVLTQESHRKVVFWAWDLIYVEISHSVPHLRLGNHWPGGHELGLVSL